MMSSKWMDENKTAWSWCVCVWRGGSWTMIPGCVQKTG